MYLDASFGPKFRRSINDMSLKVCHAILNQVEVVAWSHQREEANAPFNASQWDEPADGQWPSYHFQSVSMQSPCQIYRLIVDWFLRYTRYTSLASSVALSAFIFRRLLENTQVALIKFLLEVNKSLLSSRSHVENCLVQSIWRRLWLLGLLTVFSTRCIMVYPVGLVQPRWRLQTSVLIEQRQTHANTWQTDANIFPDHWTMTIYNIHIHAYIYIYKRQMVTEEDESISKTRQFKPV